MYWDCYSTTNKEHNPKMPIVSKIGKRLFMMIEELGFNRKVDELSNGHDVKKLLRCAASSCFDKDNICCKACDIKKCRYKCNFLDKGICEHQYLE